MDEKELQSFLIIFSIIAFFLALAIILLFIAFQKRKNKLLREQENEKVRFQQELVESQIEIREETLRNISWELHDNIGQLLTLAKIQLQNSTDEASVEEASNTIGKGLNELRNLSRLINPAILKKLSLIEAIEREIERFNRVKFLVASFDHTGDTLAIDKKIAIIIFRMLQEFFTNTIKHSRASKLLVTLQYNKGILKIEAKDNGVGFNTHKLKLKKGIGLSNIKNRAALINADVAISSEIGKGTSLCLTYKIKDL